jgi:hypothetical protein
MSRAAQKKCCGAAPWIPGITILIPGRGVLNGRVQANRTLPEVRLRITEAVPARVNNIDSPSRRDCSLAVVTMVVVLNVGSSEAPRNAVARSSPGTWAIILASALCESQAVGSLSGYEPGAPTPQVSPRPDDLPLVGPWPGGISSLASSPWGEPQSSPSSDISRPSERCNPRVSSRIESLPVLN